VSRVCAATTIPPTLLDGFSLLNDANHSSYKIARETSASPFAYPGRETWHKRDNAVATSGAIGGD
jgi:hypothetical protein